MNVLDQVIWEFQEGSGVGDLEDPAKPPPPAHLHGTFIWAGGETPGFLQLQAVGEAAMALN